MAPSTKADDKAKQTQEPAPLRLNVDDVKRAMTYIVTKGANPSRAPVESDFDWIVNTRLYLVGLVDGNEYFEQVRRSAPAAYVFGGIRGYLDFDGDGKISQGDYLRCFQSQLAYLDRHRTSFDFYLPFAGQCAFGMLCGFMIGRFAYRTYQSKFLICVLGAAGYLSFQYLAEQQIINKAVIQKQIEDKVRNALDVNQDGVLDRKDVEAFVGKNLTVVKDKLGPEMFAPGMVGALTFGVGLLRGARFI